MLDDVTHNAIRRDLIEQLAQAHREQRELEQTLAWLRYVWGIAKRLRVQAPSEEEREKWRIQSDAYMGLVVQQENVAAEIQKIIDCIQEKLVELDD